MQSPLSRAPSAQTHTCISPEHTVASVLDTHPGAARVFARHKIDFCCRGQRPIAEAAERASVPLAALVHEIESLAVEPPSVAPDLPTEALIALIVERHHRPLDEELPRLRALSIKVARVHGGPVNLAVADHFAALEAELVPHMDKEERVLFPLLTAGDPRSRAPITVMLEEHELVGEILRELRQLTHDYALPDEACGSWRALWQGLEALEHDLHEHIHLENNVLFPRALSPGFAIPAKTLAGR